MWFSNRKVSLRRKDLRTTWTFLCFELFIAQSSPSRRTRTPHSTHHRRAGWASTAPDDKLPYWVTPEPANPPPPIQNETRRSRRGKSKRRNILRSIGWKSGSSFDSGERSRVMGPGPDGAGRTSRSRSQNYASRLCERGTVVWSTSLKKKKKATYCGTLVRVRLKWATLNSITPVPQSP